MEDTYSDSQHTNAAESQSRQQTFNSCWARIGFNNLKANGLDHLVQFADYGWSHRKLFDHPVVPIDLWMHINKLGDDNVIGWGVQIAKTCNYATHRLASGILNDAATAKEAIVQLSISAPKIDNGILVRLVDDGKHMWMQCHYIALPPELLSVWCPSSALMPYSLVMSALGYHPKDCLIGFSYGRYGEMGYDRQTEYRWLFDEPTKLLFDFEQQHSAINGYFIRWANRDLSNRNVQFDLRDNIDCEALKLTLKDSVRSILREHLSKMSAKQVATRLNMSDRELRRKLEKEGVTFQSLHDEHLIHLFESPAIHSLSLAKAATRLGYGSGQSLKRAVDTAMRR